MLREASFKWSIFKWENFSFGETNLEPLIAHLLIVKNAKYAKLAQTSVTSFLHFHPNSQVILHVDNATRTAALKWIKKSHFSNSITVHLDFPDSELSWQDCKLHVLTNLHTRNEFFVDADMRWNGKWSPQDSDRDKIIFFVEEFKLKDHEVYKNLFEDPFFSKYSGASMWNTSFVYLGGLEISEHMIQKIGIIREKIIDFSLRTLSDLEIQTSTLRISEQLAMSLAAEDWPISLQALKRDDGYKDGSFLESSYFGATGTHF
jgi:hypothetical protein